MVRFRALLKQHWKIPAFMLGGGAAGAAVGEFLPAWVWAIFIPVCWLACMGCLFWSNWLLQKSCRNLLRVVDDQQDALKTSMGFLRESADQAIASMRLARYWEARAKGLPTDPDFEPPTPPTIN